MHVTPVALEVVLARPVDPQGTEAVPLPNRIATLIVERVKAVTLEPGAHIAEQALADAFRVSRTPVRVIVERRPNCGYLLRTAAGRLPRSGMPPDEAADDPFCLQIAEDRLAGRLETRFTLDAVQRRWRRADEAGRHRIGNSQEGESGARKFSWTPAWGVTGVIARCLAGCWRRCPGNVRCTSDLSHAVHASPPHC
jgi:hypothetical protein